MRFVSRLAYLIPMSIVNFVNSGRSYMRFTARFYVVFLLADEKTPVGRYCFITRRLRHGNLFVMDDNAGGCIHLALWRFESFDRKDIEANRILV